MARIITHSELIDVPDGGAVHLEPGAELTPLARERAAARGLRIERGPVAAHSADTADTADTATIAAVVTEQVAARIGATSPAALEAVTREVLATLGGAASFSGPAGPAVTSGPVGLSPSADYCSSFLAAERKRSRRRAVLTTTGRNQRGIVARIAAAIAEQGGDILDISQTLVGDFFTMLVIVDIGDLQVSFADFQRALSQVASELGVQAILMHEDLVASLHRV